jgi:hypothetical protein
MASRTLRNRTVEPSQRDDVFTSQEVSVNGHMINQDQPEQLDNNTELDETTQLSLVEANRATDTETNMTRVIQERMATITET